MLTQFNQKFRRIGNKKGIAPVVATVLLIALVMVIVAAVWVVVNNLVKGGLEESEACFGILEKVSLNSRYTCYNSGPNEFWFSISISDIDVDEVLVGISAEGNSISFKISNTPSGINNLVMYSDRSSSIILPSKNAGLTYILNITGAGFSETPNSISIAPVINDIQCGVSDSMHGIDRCIT
jgi:flagellin-like protein